MSCDFPECSANMLMKGKFKMAYYFHPQKALQFSDKSKQWNHFIEGPSTKSYRRNCFNDQLKRAVAFPALTCFLLKQEVRVNRYITKVNCVFYLLLLVMQFILVGGAFS